MFSRDPEHAQSQSFEIFKKSGVHLIDVPHFGVPPAIFLTPLRSFRAILRHSGLLLFQRITFILSLLLPQDGQIQPTENHSNCCPLDTRKNVAKCAHRNEDCAELPSSCDNGRHNRGVPGTSQEYEDLAHADTTINDQ